MAGSAEGRVRGERRRVAAWVGLGTLVLLGPLVAMAFTDEVSWSAADFALAGALVAGAAGACELAIRRSDSVAYRAGVGVALAAGSLLFWVNGAVGVIGSENHPANLMFDGVLAVALVGAVVARFRAGGMARALLAAALAQVSAALVALVAGLGSEGRIWPLDILGMTGFMAACWLLSAWLFRRASRRVPRAAGAGG